MNQFRKKYPVLYSSFEYYSGMTESAIMLVGMVDKKMLDTYIEHNRIYKNSSNLDFYNPLNMIIDVRVRDIAEYFKQQFFYVSNPLINVKNYLDYTKLSNEETALFLARLVYPSYYFDAYDEIIPTVLEIPSKQHPYSIEKDSVMQRALRQLYGQNIPEDLK